MNNRDMGHLPRHLLQQEYMTGYAPCFSLMINTFR